MEKIRREILEYYQHFSEASRLAGVSLEKIRTQELVSRFLEKQPMRILDVGGAAGVYSFWLSELGHEVHLVDASPRHIEQANEKVNTTGIKLASIRAGDARALPFEDEAFDLVLLLGPLYHLTEREDRMAAWREAKRVLRRNGVTAAAGISRYASMLDGFHSGLIDDPAYIPMMMRDLSDGQHRVPEGKPYFTTAFFHLPDELEAEAAEAGFEVIGTYAVEGFGAWLPGLGEKLADPEYRDLLLATLRTVERDRSILGVSPHLITVGQKG
jgi:ubiquinone/menaquinone biosynthesis C-methylase UbiE